MHTEAGTRFNPGKFFVIPEQNLVYFLGVFDDFLNNVWFGFTVVYGCFYYIVNAHYKG